MRITAPDDRAVHVTIFEPRQTPEQEEVIIKEFDLDAGDTFDEFINSATAGFRTTPLGDDTRPEDYGKPVPDQAGTPLNASRALDMEINAGREAQQEHERRAKEVEAARAKEQASEPEPEPEQPANNPDNPADVVIPDDWMSGHHSTKIALAHRLGAGEAVTTKTEAEEFINAEIARRNAPAPGAKTTTDRNTGETQEATAENTPKV